MRRTLAVVTALLLTLVGLAAPAAAAWQPKTPPLTTPWTSQVSPTNALPDYPRPQLVRPDWLNLNGVWDITLGSSAPASILVPYPIESALSGIQRHDDSMVYHRTFTVPADWAGRRVR